MKWLQMIFLLGALFVVIGVAYLPFLKPTGNGLTAAIYSSMIVDLTNKDRMSDDMSSLKPNALLTEAANEKANDMATKGYFAHTSPEGITPWYWFKKVGYPYIYAGENLAVNFDNSIDVENAWMNSPTHRANILNGHYTDIGIGTAVGLFQGREATFVVQEFGSTSTTSPALANATKFAQGASAYNGFLSFEIFLDSLFYHSEGKVL